MRLTCIWMTIVAIAQALGHPVGFRQSRMLSVYESSMENVPETSPGKFWEFTLSVYKGGEFSSACIWLQDQYGVDVNCLLLCLYAGVHGHALDDEVFARIENHVSAWRASVVRPLRAVRLWLRSQTAYSKEPLESLRRGILAEEIASEGHQQRLMESQLGPLNGGPSPAVAARNLMRYLSLSAVSCSKEGLDKLAILLSAALEEVDLNQAKALLLGDSARSNANC